MAEASYEKKIQISVDDGSNWLSLPTTDATLNNAGEALDTTEMETNSGYRTRILGLLDWSITGSAIFSDAHTALTAL